MFYCTIFVIIGLMVNQIRRKRLFSMASMFLLYYSCFFVFTPILTDAYDEQASSAVLVGILSFSVGYFFTCYIEKRNSDSNNQDKHIELKYNLCRDWCSLFFLLTIIFLVISMGADSVSKILHGSIATKSLIGSRSGISTVYEYCLIFWGYLIVMMCLANGSKLNKRIVVYFIAYFGIMFAFSFTRVNLVYVIGMLTVILLKNMKQGKQIIITIALLGAIAILMIIMGYVRTYGIKVGINSISIGNVQNAFVRSVDFTYSYSNFIVSIKRDVRITPLVYLKVLFLLIPRSIWHNKPYASSIEIMRQLNYSSWIKGSSNGYSLLGEAHAVMGDFGYVLYPLLFGFLVEIVDKKRTNRGYGEFAYLYLMFVFLLECFRQGVDIAIMDLPIFLIPTYLMSRCVIKYGKYRIIGK